MAKLARYYAAADNQASAHLTASGFGPHDPPYLVRDPQKDRVIEHGFRLQEAATAYAEALNRAAGVAGPSWAQVGDDL